MLTKGNVYNSQTHQTIFIQLMRAAYELTQASWVSVPQKMNIEICIKTLWDIGEFAEFPLLISTDVSIQKQNGWRGLIMTI